MQILEVLFLSGFIRTENILTGASALISPPVSNTVHIGCNPGKHLVFDVKTTLEQSAKLNQRNFSCVNPDPVIPCFYYKNTFYPSFLVQDLVSGETYRFLDSYILKVVGGGPYSRDNIHLYSPEEILRYNSWKYSSQRDLVWAVKHQSFKINKEGLIIMHGNKNAGIRWVCKNKSPCSDVTFHGQSSPRFYFVIKVSSRNMKTNCHYSSQFEIIVHTIPLSVRRKVIIQTMTITSFFSVLVLFCMVQGLKQIVTIQSVFPCLFNV
ncbi:cation channel sperm-associated protein subunit gamma 1-like isoform X2 [Triplophysa dalaica]|nr:cation channel sperm-associated protein subunit gamma 1-like isoform X2 [Triplophysa dalaica]